MSFNITSIGRKILVLKNAFVCDRTFRKEMTCQSKIRREQTGSSIIDLSSNRSETGRYKTPERNSMPIITFCVFVKY